jgi:hypothetical protein
MTGSNLDGWVGQPNTITIILGGGEWLVVTKKIHKEEGEMGEERE